ncbi:MAG: GldG family protein [Candidatus Omnitrophica bacterium]|nr:GldG family protein [Candidatus Omnitrophota bacterium]MBI2496274.1 GldG family protein [Candidatus Omnitrophota bacterium]MBI3021029.1 GldG family protein [Candidatus Omnitrophota bacterium]
MTKAWRRLVASLNFVAVLGLLFALFILVNYVSNRRYARWDLTREKLTALSDQTRRTLKALKEPVSVIVFYPPTQRLSELITDTLKEYERAGPRISVEYVDPEQDRARALQLVQEFDIDVTKPDALNLVIFQSGARRKYLSDPELVEYDYGSMGFGSEPRVKAFKGEEAFTSALISLTQNASPLVWFTDGHGEKSVEAQDQLGLSELKKSLDQQGWSIKTVTLLNQTSIPSEVKLVVVPGPTRRFTEQELLLLQSYLDQGGRCLALIDPLEDTGLDGLLERWGMTLGMDVVVDPARRIPFVSAANLLVTSYTEHPIVERMKTLMTLFPLARSLRPATTAPEGLTVTPLALTSVEGWGETQTTVEPFQFTEGQDLPGPVPIATASERATPARTRLVAIGDSDFIVNAQLGNIGNRDFLLGAIHWLVEQEQFIGIGPKALESIKLNLTSGQLTGVFWVSFLAMPLGFALLGIGMWLLRRR